jgi:ribosomal protein L12E/L44/L45/RPP1/RPP2
MAVTRLKRKHRKNIARANNKQRVIKQLLSTPVIKNVDIEELKAQFTQKAAPAAPKAAAPAAPKAEAPAEQAAPAKTEDEAAAE